ncbi:MarR family winged helix-turn-helix transcriptional regulator [Kurthia sibirica]|uniref:MarR family transcriptional regulator n=1 Tax=Kurthia sibirica TaxID=202750 RepID=A0A2U3AMB3_9BACL|nr:MarR family transcriptional regulator [Kurthia sibirica]PWI25670.1 MarR family transcriptional regulator [Kurthia sibirica]GEK33675.1 hypothetical protein KSI01_12080 [Kurthia sibirica]
MKESNLFQLIHITEYINNSNIYHFTKRFPHKLGVSPVLVLAELQKDGAQKQTVLADKLGCTPGAMTNIANKLVKQGYAERQYNEEDRRHVLMEITMDGKAVLKDAQVYGRQVQKEIFEVLSEEELDQYMAITGKLLKAAIERNEEE